MKLDKYLITLALETLLEQVRDANEDFEVINRVIEEINKIREIELVEFSQSNESLIARHKTKLSSEFNKNKN
tara:strand:- start:75 stop:290 length:216 start_codon:yes stop_codon:yes gene_type:complete